MLFAARCLREIFYLVKLMTILDIDFTILTGFRNEILRKEIIHLLLFASKTDCHWPLWFFNGRTFVCRGLVFSNIEGRYGM